MEWATSDLRRTLFTHMTCTDHLPGVESDRIIASLADGAKDRVCAKPREVDSFRGLAILPLDRNFRAPRKYQRSRTPIREPAGSSQRPTSAGSGPNRS